MPASIPDLTQPLATLLAGDLAALDVDIASPATPNPVDWGEAMRGTVQGLIQRVNGEVQLPANVGAYPRLVRDLDYTAVSSSTPGANATVSILGIDHTFQNNTSASVDLSQADLVAGTGIVLRYKTSGAGSLDISSSLNTAGGFYVTLANLIPSHRESHRYFFQWRFAVAGTWDSTDSIRFFLQSTVPAGGSLYEGVTQTGRGGHVGFNSLSSTQPSFAVMNGSTQGASRSEVLPSGGYNVIGLRTESGGAATSVWAGQYTGSTWPTLDSMILIGVTENLSGSNGSYGAHNLAITRALIALAGPAGTASPHGVDVRGCRVYDLGI